MRKAPPLWLRAIVYIILLAVVFLASGADWLGDLRVHLLQWPGIFTEPRSIAFGLTVILLVSLELTIQKRLAWGVRLLYSTFCFAGALVWVRHDSDKYVEVIIIMVTLFLAFCAIDLAMEHKGTLHKLEELIKDTHGLGEYIRQAAQIYREEGVARVVTSLRYWAADKKSRNDIEMGMTNSSKSTELVFVGPIAWNYHFPGVLWRFVKARELLLKEDRHDQKIRIYHVEDNIPLFVVSKKKNPTESDRGSLLIGNPLQGAGTILYGLDLGRGYPNQVTHYNFIFDTLICPDASQSTLVKELLKNLHMTRYESSDGICRILALSEFTHLLQTPHAASSNGGEGALIDMIAKDVGTILIEMMKDVRSLDDREYLLEEDQVRLVTREFIGALCEASLLRYEQINAKEAKLSIVDPTDDFSHTCATYFHRRGTIK